MKIELTQEQISEADTLLRSNFGCILVGQIRRHEFPDPRHGRPYIDLSAVPNSTAEAMRAAFQKAQAKARK